MALGLSRLSLLAFPQAWDGASLVVRFLCLPRGVPVDPPAAGLPDFASANIVIRARLVAGLDRLPVAADAADGGLLALDNPPVNKSALFGELANQFDIRPRVPPAGPAVNPHVLKPLTASYERVAGRGRRSDYLRHTDDYECALHEQKRADADDPVELPTSLTWGKVIAYALRQPRLAEGLGLVGQATLTPPTADFFASGGWLYFDLDAGSDYAGAANFVARYAARIPPLSAPRAVFAAVLFPVDAPATIVADDVFREVEMYDAGLARLVHGEQLANRLGSAALPERGDSIQLAWDDEQIAIWFNRQLQRKPDGELVSDTPFGVSGYRLDVRPAGDVDWHSLLRMESQGPLQLGPHDLGAFAGEGVVEAVPIKRTVAAAAAAFWLPSYFAAWRGRSLALTDPDLVDLHTTLAGQLPAGQDRLLNREKVFVPVDDAAVPLRYGNTYEFRVRLADLTRGGPTWEAADRDPAGSSVASIDFKRRTPPGPVIVLKRPGDEPEGDPPAGSIDIEKPRLGYPEALFAGRPFAEIADDAATVAGDAALTREPGVFDPFVAFVAITVEVKALVGDRTPFLRLYRTTREMPGDTLSLDLAFEDAPTLTAIDAEPPDNGPLRLPTAREVRITLAAMGAADDPRFYDDAARSGAPVVVHLRREAAAEAALFSEPVAPATVLQSFYFQPPAVHDVAPVQRLAGEVGLDQLNLTLSGRAGRRTVIGCSAALRHTLSPERSSITVASGADLLLRWVNVVRFTIERDWTWDGLAEAGMDVTRVIRRPGQPDVSEPAGTITMPRALTFKALPDGDADLRAPIRQSTDLIFFDAIDPTPDQGQFPTELTVDYVIQPAYVEADPPESSVRSTLLPITTPPSQLPRIVSAGIALSPFVRADDYSSTAVRQRVLWFEFAEPPEDLDDAYFIRVLGHGADPLLLDEPRPRPDAPEPPLPIDPESMRRITPNQPRDASGLAAMTGVTESPRSDRHYVIPIPDDLSDASPELFGFFVYEVRLGHTDARWSTAQGRFGPALRIAGVQHPAPPLDCQAARGHDDVLVRALFATPVHAGQNLRPRAPRSELWALLYARVRQLDTAAWRNVLIGQARLLRADQHQADFDARDVYGEAHFPLVSVRDALRRLGLPGDAPLTVLTAEMFGEPVQENPLGAGLGQARILRVSPLVPVPDAC